jgi:GxxExxY protein
MELLLEDLTGRIIKAYFKVHNTLGYGFLEKVYENAMCIELRKNGILCKAQFPTDVFYEGFSIGYYKADLLVEEKVIVEIKAKESLCEEHECQLINYLRATDIEVGLLMNFGKKSEFKRKIFENQFKRALIR